MINVSKLKKGIVLDHITQGHGYKVFEQLGLDLPTAFRIFLKKSVEERGIPFSMRVTSEKKALKQANNILKMANKEAKKNKIQNLTLDEINAEIRAYRKEK